MELRASSKPLDLIPTPYGVRVKSHKDNDVVPPGSVLTAFSLPVYTPAGLHPIARVQPDCVEEKGYTVSVMARGNYPQQSVVLV